jgi:hypothetical protein
MAKTGFGFCSITLVPSRMALLKPYFLTQMTI